MTLNPTCECGHKMNDHRFQGPCRSCACVGYLKPGNERPEQPTGIQADHLDDRLKATLDKGVADGYLELGRTAEGKATYTLTAKGEALLPEGKR